MDRIKKVRFLIFLFFYLLFFCYPEELQIPNRLKNEEKQLTNVYVQRLYEGQKGFANDEDFKYICDVSKKINSFLTSLQEMKISDYASLIGNYKLMDYDGNYITEENGFFLSNYFSILSTNGKVLSFQDKSSTTKIYQDSKGCFFFQTRWIEAIRQLKIIDDKIYIYILDGDYWILDSIHNGGKYFFRKTDKDVNNKFSNLKDWFERL